MKRVGIIDNLVGINWFRERRFHTATAAEVMQATGGNTGNVAFVYAVQQIIGNPMRRVEWPQLAGPTHADLDHLVVCCANQLGPHADLGGWADALEAFGKPVTLIGLGAQSESFNAKPAIPEGTRRFLNVVAKLQAEPGATNIGVRGAYSQSVLADLGVESIVTGCPSLLIGADKSLGETILARQGRNGSGKPWVAVAAGNPWHGASSFLERILVDLVDQYRGSYVLQHPQSMLEIAFGETGNVSEVTRKRFLEVYGERFDFEQLLNWYHRNSTVFVDVPNWIRFLQHFDLAVGPRYHGVALGVQAGIPGCVFAIDTRTQEMCDESGIKSIPVGQLKGKDAASVLELCRWNIEDSMRLDESRVLKASALSALLASNKLQASKHLISLSS